MVKVPYALDDLDRLRFGRRIPEWDRQYKCWLLPRSHLDNVIVALVTDYGQVYLIQPYREKEVCAPACWNALGFECECSCMGLNHGRDHRDRWFEISETLAVRWGERKYACRLITRRRSEA